MKFQFSYSAGNLLTTRGIASHWRRVVVTCDIKECRLFPRSSESIGDQHVLKTDMFLLYAYMACIESALTLCLFEFFIDASHLHTYMYTYIHTYIHACMRTYIHVYIHSFIHSYIHTCMNASCIHTYMHTYRHTYIHTCVHTYMHAYIHTYIHAYIKKLTKKTL